MKKIDLWASDSEESITKRDKNETNPTAVDNDFKVLYQEELKRRKELEVIVEKQTMEIQKLRSQLALNNSKLNFMVNSDSEEDLFLTKGSADAFSGLSISKHNNSKAQAMLQDNRSAARSISPLPVAVDDQNHWKELAQQEQERRKQARRAVKGKSLRLPLKAAVQQLSSRADISATTKADNAVAQSGNAVDTAESTDPSSTNNTETSAIGDGAQQDDNKEKKFRTIPKRHVRRDNNSKRLSVRSLPRDYASLMSIRTQLAALDSVPEARPVSLDAVNVGTVRNVFDESEDSDWDSPAEASPGPDPHHGATGREFTSIDQDATNSIDQDDIDELELDASLIRWARGKSLVELLNSLPTISPPNIMPDLPILTASSSLVEIRKNYL